MTRKIKGLGLAFVAIAAMSMAAASAAQATELHATTSATSVSIFGDQKEQHTFLTSAGQVKCNGALFEATVDDQGQSADQLTAKELQVTATYGDGSPTACTAFGLNAQIIMNGCKYTITNKNAADATTDKTAYVDITGCTAGKQIEVKSGANCTVTVPEQHHLGSIVFTNESKHDPGPPTVVTHDTVANIDVQGITYEAHGFCPNMQGATATKLHHNGRYHGKSTFQARQDINNQASQLHNHPYQKLGQTGALISLEAT